MWQYIHFRFVIFILHYKMDQFQMERIVFWLKEIKKLLSSILFVMHLLYCLRYFCYFLLYLGCSLTPWNGFESWEPLRLMDLVLKFTVLIVVSGFLIFMFICFPYFLSLPNIYFQHQDFKKGMRDKEASPYNIMDVWSFLNLVRWRKPTVWQQMLKESRKKKVDETECFAKIVLPMVLSCFFFLFFFCILNQSLVVAAFLFL